MKCKFMLNNLLSFFQLLVDNPLLIDDRAFNIGVYVLITSIDPLRFYRWKSDISLRVCPEPYDPFDANNVDKYVVSDSHIPAWETPSLRTAMKSFNYSTLDAFNYLLLQNDCDKDKLWQQIDDAITSTILSKASLITHYSNEFKHDLKPQFFELLQFDFIIDEELKPYLMEIEMSPNLAPSSDELFDVNYEQIIYNTISILGLDDRSKRKPRYVSLQLHIIN